MTYLICIANDYTQIVNQEEQFTPEQQEVKQWAENLTKRGRKGSDTSMKSFVELIKKGILSGEQFIAAYAVGIGATEDQKKQIQEMYDNLLSIVEKGGKRLDGKPVSPSDIPLYLNFSHKEHPNGFPTTRVEDFLTLFRSILRNDDSPVTLYSMVSVAKFWFGGLPAKHITFAQSNFIGHGMPLLSNKEAFPNLQSITVASKEIADQIIKRLERLGDLNKITVETSDQAERKFLLDLA
ncbi:hypothetical protein [Candidatus Regiella endosymbiont of Tuberolachnus salignus]|uniref:hypothetical protein n=1 Tax=Candidatus Regiella endosymbiont of Tuberolachnus salignus TaxID=3077956 RepID=UPI0030D2A0A3